MSKIVKWFSNAGLTVLFAAGGVVFTLGLIYVGYVIPIHILQWMLNW